MAAPLSSSGIWKYLESRQVHPDIMLRSPGNLSNSGIRANVAVIDSRDGVPQLLEGLRTLEDRGHDSAGVASVEAEQLQADMPSRPTQKLLIQAVTLQC